MSNRSMIGDCFRTSYLEWRSAQVWVCVCQRNIICDCSPTLLFSRSSLCFLLQSSSRLSAVASTLFSADWPHLFCEPAFTVMPSGPSIPALRCGRNGHGGLEMQRCGCICRPEVSTEDAAANEVPKQLMVSALAENLFWGLPGMSNRVSSVRPNCDACAG